MAVRWSARALRHLVSLRKYIAEDNPSAAARVATHIVDAVTILAEYPGLGRPGRVPSTRELVISGTPYIVAYAVREGGMVDILAVLHAAQKWPEKF